MSAIDQLGTRGGDRVQRAVSWWLAELRGLMPWERPGRVERAPAILDVSPAGVTLTLAARESAPADALPLNGVDPQELRERVRAALRARRLGDGVMIRLDPAVLLRSSVTLPLAAESTLRPILENQLERLVPLPSSEVCFQYRVLSRSVPAKRVNVELVIARRATIDSAVALAQSAGLVPRLAFAAGEQQGHDAALVLWRASGQASDTIARRRLKRAMEAMVVLLLVATYATYVYRLDERRDELQSEIALLTKKAAVARTLVQQQAATQSAITLLEQRRKEPSPLALLNELTGLIPTSAWVSQLNLRKRNIEIIGYSRRRVSSFVPRINNSDSFWNLKFRSPIALSPDGKGERFDIAFDVWVEDAP